MSLELTDAQSAAILAGAQRALEAIVVDLEDRHGLGDEWSQIDDDVLGEIKNVWLDIIRHEIAHARMMASPY